MGTSPEHLGELSEVRARKDLAELGEEDAEAYVGGICFKTGPPRRTGVELEWLVRDCRDPALPVPPERLDAALAPLERPGRLPHGSRLSREPGGQVELSSLPADTLADCVTATATDLAVLRHALARAGLALDGRGLDHYRSPSRAVDTPRYRAMETYFDHDGPWGRTMMCSSASVQVCLDAGDDTDGVTGYRHRWRLAHRLGPVLVAAFANSPIWQGRPTGWASSRQAIWGRTDPGRTLPPGSDGDPRAAWARYALDAPLLCLRRPAPAPWTVPRGLAFRAWLHDPRKGDLAGGDLAGDLAGGDLANGDLVSGDSVTGDLIEGEAAVGGPRGVAPRSGGCPGRADGGSGTVPSVRRPTLDDLDYHLGTLFPPVRPRGWLELRMIDAQPMDGWVVAAAVAATLLDDPEAADSAYRATAPLCGDPGSVPDVATWLRAARHGPADPCVGRAVRRCLAAAATALDRDGIPTALHDSVVEFAERYADRGRCPADDQLDALRSGAWPGPHPRPDPGTDLDLGLDPDAYLHQGAR